MSRDSNHGHPPSVDRVMRELGAIDLPRPAVLAVTRAVLAGMRADPEPNGNMVHTIAQVRSAAQALRRRRIQPVINATGIIIHTNLGRSPLGTAAAQALVQAATHYSTLEFDLDSGERGKRGEYVENALAILCGSESATVVNNCAAALVLTLRHFAARGSKNRVAISRGELVQIGGGFRIPEILQASGAELREIGTTNATAIDDYRTAIDDRTALILRVHRSNFYMGGFTASPTTSAIAALAKEAGVPFVVDIGSGATFDTQILGGGEQEPMAADVLAAGADLVCFSGDKLLGGPQAGIIAGARERIEALKTEPFFRALRCDKLVLAALEATVDATLAGRIEEIPIRAMMSASVEALRIRAERAVAAMTAAGVHCSVGESRAQVGGGSLPQTSLPSVSVNLIASPGHTADGLSAALRQATPPIIACVSQDRVRMDLRTIFPTQDEQWIKAVIAAALPGHESSA